MKSHMPAGSRNRRTDMAEEKKDFIVKDRRFFAQEDTAKEASPLPEKEKTKEEAPPRQTEAKEAPAEDSQLPEINFATFILSLHSSALVHLGVVENPATGQKSKSLGLAKQTIDILGIIEKKTQGNLDKDEENLLKNLLHDLRLMYVKEKG